MTNNKCQSALFESLIRFNLINLIFVNKNLSPLSLIKIIKLAQCVELTVSHALCAPINNHI